MAKGIKYTGSFGYLRDYDGAQVTAKFSVASETETAPPASLGGAYNDCLGTILQASCSTCARVTPRYFDVVVITAADTPAESHKVPVGDKADLQTCFNALNAVGIDRCISYKGEDWKNIHVLAP